MEEIESAKAARLLDSFHQSQGFKLGAIGCQGGYFRRSRRSPPFAKRTGLYTWLAPGTLYDSKRTAIETNIAIRCIRIFKDGTKQWCIRMSC